MNILLLPLTIPLFNANDSPVPDAVKLTTPDAVIQSTVPRSSVKLATVKGLVDLLIIVINPLILAAILLKILLD